MRIRKDPGPREERIPSPSLEVTRGVCEEARGRHGDREGGLFVDPRSGWDGGGGYKRTLGPSGRTTSCERRLCLYFLWS
ncbi:unnamed protein product [Arctogadus glacialis]